MFSLVTTYKSMIYTYVILYIISLLKFLFIYILHLSLSYLFILNPNK